MSGREGRSRRPTNRAFAIKTIHFPEKWDQGDGFRKTGLRCLRVEGSLSPLDAPKEAPIGTTIPPGLIWITGFPGAGKSETSICLASYLTSAGSRPVRLDGDEVRGILRADRSFSRESRVELTQTYLRLAENLVGQGFTVLLSAVGLFKHPTEWMRSEIPISLQVFLDVPLNVRIGRHRRASEIYPDGADISHLYDAPVDYDLLLKNAREEDIERNVATIVDRFVARAAQTLKSAREDHWNSFYSEGGIETTPSPFAVSCAKEVLSSQTDILEIGCGNGRDAAYFASLGHNVTAIDPSNSAIQVAKRTFSNSAVNFLVGSLSTTVDGLLGSFEAVYCRFVLHAMTAEDERKTLQEAFAILLPKGVLMLETRSAKDSLASRGGVLSQRERIEGHYRRFADRVALESALTSLGFEIVETKEEANLAPYKDENPVVLRIIARKPKHG